MDDTVSRRAVIDTAYDSKNFKNEFDRGFFIDKIKDLPPAEMAEWIPTSKKLPEDGQIVLICQLYSWKEFEEGTEVTIAQYKRKHFTWYRYQKDWDQHTSIMSHGDICPGNEYVVAWMPLPEPYRAEGSKDERM